MKLLVVVGTRPEAIKMAPLIVRLKKYAYFSVKVCNTGQHEHLVTPIFNLFGIKPDFNLYAMVPNQGLHG